MPECAVISIITLVLERGGLRRHYHDIRASDEPKGLDSDLGSISGYYRCTLLENIERFKVQDFPIRSPEFRHSGHIT